MREFLNDLQMDLNTDNSKVLDELAMDYNIDEFEENPRHYREREKEAKKLGLEEVKIDITSRLPGLTSYHANSIHAKTTGEEQEETEAHREALRDLVANLDGLVQNTGAIFSEQNQEFHKRNKLAPAYEEKLQQHMRNAKHRIMRKIQKHQMLRREDRVKHYQREMWAINGMLEKNFDFCVILEVYNKYKRLDLVPTHFNFPEFFAA